MNRNPILITGSLAEDIGRGRERERECVCALGQKSYNAGANGAVIYGCLVIYTAPPSSFPWLGTIYLNKTFPWGPPRILCRQDTWLSSLNGHYTPVPPQFLASISLYGWLLLYTDGGSRSQHVAESLAWHVPLYTLNVSWCRFNVLSRGCASNEKVKREYRSIASSFGIASHIMQT